MLFFKCSKEGEKKTRSLRKRIRVTRPQEDGNVSMQRFAEPLQSAASVWIWSRVGRAAPEIARASRLFPAGEKCSNWLRPSDLCSSRRHERGREAWRWGCPLEASGAGSVWLLPSDKPPAKSDWIGAVTGGSAKHSSPPGNCSCLHRGRIWKDLKVRNISFEA